ncbi:MAG: putative signal transducing protein [Mucilaginibacter sp.]
MDDRIVTFESYYDPMQAHTTLAWLEDNDIPCFLADDNMLWAKPYFNQLLGGVKIKVFEKDLERCREVLAVQQAPPEQDFYEFTSEENADKLCPYCSSTDVRFGIATEPRFHLLSLLASIYLFVPVYFRTAWHCFNCHREF